MSVDPGVVDLAARLDGYGKRIQRLETLEYETEAFPSGGGPSLISDVVVAAGPVASVTIPPTPLLIPQTFLHLWLIMSAQSSLATPGVSPGFTANVTFNPPVAPSIYRHLVRFENISGVGVGAGDIQSAFGGPTFTVVIRTCSPAAPGGVNGLRSACFVIIPDYTNTTTHPNKTATSFGYSFGQDSGEGSSTQSGGDTAGTPGSAPGAVTSILITAPFAPGGFVTGSQFTLYGL